MSDQMYTSNEYLEKNPTWHVEDSPWKAGQILKMMRQNNLTSLSIAEIGCGAGEILNQLYQQLPDTTIFTGYELSPQAIELCRPKQNDRLKFHLKDLLTEPNISYDLVLAIDVVEHVEDYLSFLRQLRTKGKYKIFHLPLDLSAQSVLRGRPIIDQRRDVGHLHYFTKDTALASLTETGYKIIDYFYTAGSIDLPAKSLSSRLLRLPRRILFKLNPDFTVRLLGGYSLMVLTE
ncbi:TPA: methylase [Candidatus Falkowbacteria bacterium]|nr:methylase [Candidatus Falkowbacteria bacterium]